MDKINRTLIALLLVLYSSVTTFAVMNEIDTCGQLNADGGYYILNKSVESAGTCFIISEDNITLDGAGYYVNFSSLRYGDGILNHRHKNVTVKNMVINQINISLPYQGFNDTYYSYMRRGSKGELIDSKGIKFYLSDNGLISNIITNVSRESIQIYSSNNNTIINSTAVSIRSAAIFIYNASNTKVINSRGISTTTDTNKLFDYVHRSVGIQLTYSYNNTIINSTGISDIGRGLTISASNNNTIINSTGISNIGIGLLISKSNNNTVIDGKFSSIDNKNTDTIFIKENNSLTNNKSTVPDMISIDTVRPGENIKSVENTGMTTVLLLIILLSIIIIIHK